MECTRWFSRMRNFVQDLATDHYHVLFLFFAFASLTLCGALNNVVISLTCILLSLAGFFAKNIKINPITFSCLSILFLVGVCSSYLTSGYFFSGYAAMWLVFIPMYLILGCLSVDEQNSLYLLMIIWSGIVVGGSMLWYAIYSLSASPGRFDGLVQNPNAMGIFIVIAWFLSFKLDDKRVRFLEPILLTGLSMTLSMGSFLSLAVALLYLMIVYCREDGFKNAFLRICKIGARIVLCFYVGFLFYFSVNNSFPGWVVLLPLIVLVAMMFIWDMLLTFFEENKFVSIIVLCLAICLGVFAIYLRPSALATFTERLDMIQSGCHYLFKNPVLGIGQYHWRVFDRDDGGTYFNTWYIHNAFVHVGVEVGLIAMVCMLVIVVLCFMQFKKSHCMGWLAFVVHSLLDVGFFYSCIPVFVLLGHRTSTKHDIYLSNRLKNVIFVILLCFSLWYLRCVL